MTNKLVVIINSLKVPKIKKILLYEMKFLVPNYSCLQSPWLWGYHPQILILSVLCPQLNLLNPPPQTKFLGTPLLKILVEVRPSFTSYIRSPLFAVSVHTTITSLHIFLSFSYSLLLLSGWWLFYSHFRKVEIFIRIAVDHPIFMTWRKSGTVCVPHRILWDFGTKLLKIYRTGSVLGKPNFVRLRDEAP